MITPLTTTSGYSDWIRITLQVTAKHGGTFFVKYRRKRREMSPLEAVEYYWGDYSEVFLRRGYLGFAVKSVELISWELV